jgi:aspartyl-tRNA(Asn)/glutamyl-tRNA(Gln) amidotransferase subunit B
VLTDSKEIAFYFEDICKGTLNYKAASNWVMGPLKSYLNEHALEADQFPVPAKIMSELIQLVDSGKVNFTNASQRIFNELIKDHSKSPLQHAQELNLIQDSNEDAILPIVEEVIREFPLKVEEYKKGKKGIIGMFVGEVKKRSHGKADMKIANELIIKKLEEV